MAATDEIRRFGRDLDLPETVDAVIRVTPTGDLRDIAGRDNLHRAVRLRALSAPGTLVHRPDYGGGLELHVETPNTPASRSAINTTLRRNALLDVRLEDVTVSTSSGRTGSTSGDAVTVRLEIRARGDVASDALNLTVE